MPDTPAMAPLRGAHAVRRPTNAELWAVAEARHDQGATAREAVRATATGYHAVIEGYATDCPGYAGSVILEVSGAGPAFYSAFVEDQDGRLRELDRTTELQR